MRNIQEIEYAYMSCMRFLWRKAKLDSVPYTEQEQSATSSKECVYVCAVREDKTIDININFNKTLLPS